MKAMSKAELELEKLISKLEGQLASAHYALSLLRQRNAEMHEPDAYPSGRAPEPAILEHSGEGIPLFS